MLYLLNFSFSFQFSLGNFQASVAYFLNLCHSPGNDLTHEHFQSQAMPTPQTCRPSVSQLSVGSSRGYFSEHQHGQTAFKVTSSEGYFNECQHRQTTFKTSSSRGYFSEQQNQHLISQRLKPVPHSSLAASKQGIVHSQWLDTDVHSTVTAKMSTALWQRKQKVQQCDSSCSDNAKITICTLV